MKFYLKDTCLIRPIAFLCGPYFRDQENDRRKILQDYLACKPLVSLPIIVDKFLDKKNIDDDSIRIPLLEEICAAASYKIYIFLDTFSSVAELGMFSHASTSNSLVVFLPEKKDKLTEQINFFVKEVLTASNIKTISYHPRITRVPIASDYVIEYYEFSYNKLPDIIKEEIDTDAEYKKYEVCISFNIADSLNRDSYNVINYLLDSNSITFFVNLRLMFYIVASIIVTISEIEPTLIVQRIKEILLLSIHCSLSVNQVNISTNLLIDNKTIIELIIKFLALFEKFGQVTGEKIVTKDFSFIRCASIIDYFQLNGAELGIISDYIDNNDNFVETFTIQKGTKTRKLVRYNTAQSGIALRNLHEKIVAAIEQNYQFSDSSFAYRKHYGIRQCVSRHINSVCFLKIDISSFFNSITYSKLYNTMKHFFKDDIVYDQNYAGFIKSLMHKNILPLGYVSSPIISDIYLSTFDSHIINALHQQYPCVIYSRYADDMIFSCATDLDQLTTSNIEQIVCDELEQIQLRINSKKTTITKLESIGNHVKLLGLNIVKTVGENKLTVGRKYIYDTAKLLLTYLNNLFLMSQEFKYYQEKLISGRIAYINQIDGEEGYALLQYRVLSSTHGRLRIPNNRVDFNDNVLMESLRSLISE